MRECPAIQEVLEDLSRELPEASPPQVLFIDGNGVFHPRGFGVACQVGVLADVPTIGIAKNLLEIRDDGVFSKDVKVLCEQHLTAGGTFVNIVGNSGIVYGAGVRSVDGAKNPVFVSNGHRVSLETAVSLTLAVSKHRQPEPIRFADHLGREFIRTQK
ncbi:endonuclease V [Obelidium mucronatum]|nr:endonuclease V [Obelidium mucronatum]